MKRMLSLLLAVYFAAAFAVNTLAAEGIAVLPETSGATAEIPLRPVVNVGTTPREAAGAQLQDVSLKDAAASTEIYNNILACEPAFFLYTDEGIQNINGWKVMSDLELEYVKGEAAAITNGCTTADQKIYAVAEYVAQNVGYDYDYYYHQTKEYADLNHNAYDVLKNGSAVCQGYAATVAALLQLLDIPCIMVYSPGHAWNMAYNGERWILLDTTWMSYSHYENGVLQKDTRIDMDWFDYTISDANADTSHVITDADYAVCTGTIRSFPVYSKAETFRMPDSITGIGDYAFYGCANIDIVCSKNLEVVGRAAFYNCRKLGGVLHLENIQSLSEYAFYGCSSITGIIMGEGITEIPNSAFYGCSALSEVVIPKSVVLIDTFALAFAGDEIHIYYTGTQDEWEAVSIKEYNYSLIYGDVTVTYNHVPHVELSKSGSSSSMFSVTYEGILSGETVIFAEYRNGRFLGLRCAPLKKNMLFALKNRHAKEITVFVVDGAKSFKPLLSPVSASK